MNSLKIIRTSLVLAFISLSSVVALSQSFDSDLKTKTLFSHLDTNTLKGIISNQNNLATSANELLDFYKKRNTINHPITSKSQNTTITDQDLKYANDALKHLFVGQPAYPPYFCGEDINWNFRPVPDNEWVWQLNRMYFWNAMGNVYAKTGDERYAKE